MIHRLQVLLCEDLFKLFLDVPEIRNESASLFFRICNLISIGPYGYLACLDPLQANKWLFFHVKLPIPIEQVYFEHKVN